jgi:hypothetical protein
MIRTLALCAAVLALTAAPSAQADPGPAAIQVSASNGLTEGQRITVDGNGFRSGLASVAVGLCKKGFTNGLRDCDLTGGATFVNVTDDGALPTVTLTARPRFNDIDCTQQQCVIAAAPLPGAEPPAIIAANSAEVAVDFTGSHLAPTTPAAPSTAAASDIDGPSLPLWSATAALLILVAALTLADRRRL